MLGDFNEIQRAQNVTKKCNVNRGRIILFRAVLQACELNEIHLQNKKFTWSNAREKMLCKLDALYSNSEWNLRFDTHILHTLSSSLSGHYPLLLDDDSGPRRSRSFKFENFWLRLPGFNNVVQQA
jgi:hypothetical protein